MLIRQLFACVIVALSLTAAAEARASCVDQSICLCPFETSVNAAFAGTITSVIPAGGGDPESATLGIRLDTVALAGESTTLVVGSVIQLSISAHASAASNGVRVIGVAKKDCWDVSVDCDPAAKETAEITQIAVDIASIRCSDTVLVTTPDAVARAMVKNSCSSEINHLLDEAGIDTTCHDTCATRPGPVPSTGWWAGLVGVAALVARRRLRRAPAHAE